MIEIKHRWTGKVIFSSDVVDTIRAAMVAAVSAKTDLSGANLRDAYLRHANLRDADLRDAYLRGADLSGAYLSGANLRDANLRDANLRDANLRDAYLRGANLSGAYLRGANLSGADLSGANLSGADLSGANLRDAYLRHADLRDADLSGANLPTEGVPVIEHLDAKILEAVSADGCALEMGDWHQCETTHCRAGWAIRLAGDAGKHLETNLGSAVAGTLIYHASTGRVPDFYASNEDAIADIVRCAK